jgi:uncharacterized MAPEG superfamily protein
VGNRIPPPRLRSQPIQILRQPIPKNLHPNPGARPNNFQSCPSPLPSPFHKSRIIRAEAAQTNGFENLPLFATAVLAGNLAGLPASTLNTLSGGYLISGVLYNLVYIDNTTEALGHLRSVVFLAGIGQIFTIFVKSGNVLREEGGEFIVRG